MNDARLRAWRRRLNISPVMDKRLRRLVRAVEREEREACVNAMYRVLTYPVETFQDRLADAIRGRKDAR